MKMKEKMKAYHPIVWTLLFGTVFARGASFMALPFLALYLSQTKEVHPILIGLIIGIGPLSGTIGGFIGGHLSDKYGRKIVMITAMFVWGLVYIGFSIATSVAVFFLLNAINGICRSFFEPTSQALMADVTEKERRLRVFSMRYTAINMGAALGPLLGAYVGITNANWTFMFTGFFYFLYAIVLLLMISKYEVSSNTPSSKKTTMVEAFGIVRKDAALRFFIIGGILVNVGYSQIESSLPQHLSLTLADGVLLYSVLLSLNAIAVIILQIPLSRFAERFRVMHTMMIGSGFFALGFIGFALSDNWVLFILSMIVLTIGEIFVFPSTSVFIDQIAPEEMRGTYFGAGQFRSAGFFIGPAMGGWIFSEWSGTVLYLLMGLIVLASIYFYKLGDYQRRKVQEVEARVSTQM